jgi:hypothetical protein
LYRVDAGTGLSMIRVGWVDEDRSERGESFGRDLWGMVEERGVEKRERGRGRRKMALERRGSNQWPRTILKGWQRTFF